MLKWRLQPSYYFKCPSCSQWLLEGNSIDDCPEHRNGSNRPHYNSTRDGPVQNRVELLSAVSPVQPELRYDAYGARITKR